MIRKEAFIFCKCGCGKELNKYDSRNRMRLSFPGHLGKFSGGGFKKGQKAWNKGIKGSVVAWNKGKKMSEEFREKMRQSNRQNPRRYWLGKPRYDMRGPKSNFWTGVNHKTQRQKMMETLEYKTWRRSVFERDSYTCQKCFVKGGHLNADHIKPFALFPELRLEIANGQALCVKCHLKKTISERKLPINSYEKN